MRRIFYFSHITVCLLFGLRIALAAPLCAAEPSPPEASRKSPGGLLRSLLDKGQGATPAPPPAAPPAFAVLDLDGPLYERPPVFPFLAPDALTVREWTGAVQRAAKDPAVKGLLVRIAGPEIGFARAAEIHRAILRFRESGKPAWALLQSEGPDGYSIACACDQIVLPESSLLLLTGYRAELIYLRGLLSKIGVEAEVAAIGRYKSALEAFERSEMSEETREVLTSLLDDLTSQTARRVAEGRNLAFARALSLFEGGPYTAAEALDAGLVDLVAYPEDVYARIEEEFGHPLEWLEDYATPAASEPPPSLFSLFSELLQAGKPAPVSTTPYIALLYATGPIVPGAAEDYPFSEEMVTELDFLDTLDEIESDAQARALVLRIDSPGGSAEVSDRIWNRLRLLGETMPVVVSMGDVAASGGYYIALPASAILAEEGTLTGSIGVIAGKFNMKSLYEKIGVTRQSLSGGPYSGIFSEAAPWSEAERAKMNHLLEDMYQRFVAKAAEGRAMTPAALERVAQGRVWTGRQALEAGLVDELGGLGRAIEIAARRAGLPVDPEPEIVVFPRPMTFFEYINRMMGGKAMGAMSSAPAQGLGISPAAPLSPAAALALYPAEARRAMVVSAMLRRSPFLALAPFFLEIH